MELRGAVQPINQRTPVPYMRFFLSANTGFGLVRPLFPRAARTSAMMTSHDGSTGSSAGTSRAPGLPLRNTRNRSPRFTRSRHLLVLSCSVFNVMSCMVKKDIETVAWSSWVFGWVLFCRADLLVRLPGPGNNLVGANEKGGAKKGRRPGRSALPGRLPAQPNQKISGFLFIERELF